MTSAEKNIHLLRVHLPESQTTLVKVNDTMTFGEIIHMIAEKKMLSIDSIQLLINKSDKEIEPPSQIAFAFYRPKEVYIRYKEQPSSGLLKSSSGARSRPSSIIGFRSLEMKGTSDFPVTMGASMNEDGTSSNSSTLNRPSLSIDTDSLKRRILTAEQRSATLRSQESGEDSAHSLNEALSAYSINSITESTNSLNPNLNYHRKRTSSNNIKGITIKKNHFRAGSSSYTLMPNAPANHSSHSLPTDGVSNDSILLRVLLNSETNSMKISLQCTMDDVLRFACTKFNIEYDEYTIQLPDTTLAELDKSLSYYYGLKISEIRLVKEAKKYSMMSVVEEGEEVMVLQTLNTGVTTIMAATPGKLIEAITDDSSKDPSFLDTLLLTFRSFMKPCEFFDALIDRFNASPPQEASMEDMAYFDKMIVIIQHRVVDIISYWTKNYWHDFSIDISLRNDVKDFVEAFHNVEDFRVTLNNLLITIEEQVNKEEEIQNQRKNIDSKKKAMESMIDELDNMEVLAKQVALHDFELFCQISPIEFLNLIWRKKDYDPIEWATPNLDFFSQRFDLESYWTASEIVRVEDLKKRTKTLQKFINLAKESQLINNYYSMFAIYAGLSMPSVRRLNKTWEGLPSKYKQTYDEIEKYCDPSKNMKAYRDLLFSSTPPTLPFLPIYTKDLTFMNDGNAAMYKNMINFDKLRMMASRVREVKSLTYIVYPYDKDPMIQNYLHKPKIETNSAKLKEMSLLREPNQ